MSSKHNPQVCGIYAGSDCEDCRAGRDRAAREGYLWEFEADRLRIVLGLPRRPLPLSQERRAEILLYLADLAESVRRDPQMGVAVRGLLGSLLGGHPE